MYRANRHRLPGHVRHHLMHRCHQTEFLLEFSRDRDRSRHCDARKRFGLSVLDFVITSDHVHLLVNDTGLHALGELFGCASLAERQEAQHRWIEESSRAEGRAESHDWSNAIAVESPDFVAKVKADLGVVARNRNLDMSGVTGVLREPATANHHDNAIENGRPSEENSRLQNEG